MKAVVKEKSKVRVSDEKSKSDPAWLTSTDNGKNSILTLPYPSENLAGCYANKDTYSCN